MKRLIFIFLCISVFISLSITVSAADDDIKSYVYLDFENPSNLSAGQTSKTFVVHGDHSITSNSIFLLCSRDSNISLSGLVSDYYTFSVDELWKNGTVCCYQVKANSAYAFNGDFSLSLTNSENRWGAFNVYQVFYVGTGGIVNLNSVGGSWRFGDADIFDVTLSGSISSYPFLYNNLTQTKYGYLDIDVPIKKLVGFDQIGFDFQWSGHDIEADIAGAYELDSFLESFTVLYNNMPIPYEFTTEYSNIDSDFDLDLHLNYPSAQFLYNHGYGFFSLPEQYSSGGVITLRFIFRRADDGFYIRMNNLTGRYSFVRSEYELLSDIYNVLSGLDFDTTALEQSIKQLQSVLHSDLAGIQSSINESNTLLSSIRNYISNFRTQVANGFVNVGNWFVEFGNKFSSSIAEWGQNIVDALVNTDKDAADDFVDKSDDQSSDISSSVDKIDQIVKPNLDDILNPTVPPVEPSDPTNPVDPTAPTEDPASKPVEVLDPETVGSFAGVFGVFFENGMFSSIFSFVLLMMLASYVLFGKK